MVSLYIVLLTNLLACPKKTGYFHVYSYKIKKDNLKNLPINLTCSFH